MSITQLSSSDDVYTKEVFSYIAQRAHMNTLAGDAGTYIELSSSDNEWLANRQYQEVQAQHLSHGQHFASVGEAYDKVFLKLAGDALINNKTGVGTLLDPAIYTHSQIPIMLGPYEGSSLYAPGGLPASIIDKKSRGMVINGATFKSADKDFWDMDKIDLLDAAAVSTGFNDAIGDALADAYIYGGSIIYPVFKKEVPSAFLRPMEKLIQPKDCIERWVNVDRWNTMIVPSYIVTDADYLRPKTLFIPQAALEINTSRVAMLKPKPMPYWVTLYNMGWSPSDFSGWLRSYYGYEITCQSIPVMAQQMSLLLYRMPLDGLNATIGPERVRDLMKLNEENMATWSALSPKAVNMVGEVEVVNRTYSGFEQFIGAMKSDLAAQCGIPEPSLWHTPNKGFSDNTTESLLKQSETLHMGQSFIERSMKPCTNALVAHVFGTDSKEWENRDTIRMSFTKPIVSTEKDMAEIGARFAASVSSFCQAGVSPDVALDLSKQFFPQAKITEELKNAAKSSYEEQLKNGMNGQLGGGMGHTIGVNQNTGKGTKPK